MPAKMATWRSMAQARTLNRRPSSFRTADLAPCHRDGKSFHLHDTCFNTPYVALRARAGVTSCNAGEDGDLALYGTGPDPQPPPQLFPYSGPCPLPPGRAKLSST